MVTIFGAVAAVLATGLSLTSFAAAAAADDSRLRIIIAATGIGLAALGVIAGLLGAASVFTPEIPTVEEIAQDEHRYIREYKRRPEYISGYRTFDSLRQDFDDAVMDLDSASQRFVQLRHVAQILRRTEDALHQAEASDPHSRETADRRRSLEVVRAELRIAKERVVGHKGALAGTQAALAAAEAAEETADAEFVRMRGIVALVLPTFGYLKVLRRFYWARIWMAVAAALIIGGVAATAWALNPAPPDPVRLSDQNPAAPIVNVTFTRPLSSTLRAVIGPQCGGDSRPVRALLLGGTSDTADVILLPEGGCEPTRLEVTDKVATLERGGS
jgi:hypothetical protein